MQLQIRTAHRKETGLGRATRSSAQRTTARRKTDRINLVYGQKNTYWYYKQEAMERQDYKAALEDQNRKKNQSQNVKG